MLFRSCGANYQDGWVNLDIESLFADVLHDLRMPLPFETDAADYIYCEHFIEHVSIEEGLSFFAECRRVLKNNGVLRVSTPDLRWLIAQYVAGSTDEWRDVGWSPSTTCKLVNEGMRSWGHQFLYDEAELVSAMYAAGFATVRRVEWGTSSHLELRNCERRPDHRELIIEAS